MIPCLGCHRHIREDEPSCPFCGVGQGQTGAPTGWASGAHAMLLAGAMALGTSGCGPAPSGASEAGTTTTASATETGAISTETDTGDQTNTSADTSLSFYAPAEDFTPIAQCDPFLQDCPEGEKCVPYGSTGGNWNANKCVPVLGDGGPGDACSYDGVVSSTDSCDETSFCWDVQDVEGESIGTCTSFCSGTPNEPECPPGSACVVSNDGSITLCQDLCDPLEQACPEGLGCYWAWSQQHFTCLLTTQDLPTGTSCGFYNDCAPGNVCLDAEVLTDCQGAACCTSFCDLGDPQACADQGLTCTAFFDIEGGAPVGLEHIGVCLAPP